MPESKSLRSNSVLFWLVALLAAGIIFIGVRFLISPAAGAEGFGVPVSGDGSSAYLWAKGTRDTVSGLVGLAFLWMGVSRRVLGTYLAVVALVPVGDLINVLLNRGIANPTALIIHGTTAVSMIVIALFLLAGQPKQKH